MEPNARVLLVEDDPVSRRVLEAAIVRCGLQVDSAGCMRSAQCVAAPARHVAWLIDAHLPDGTGSELLAALRRADPATVAIAHTASCSGEMHQALRDAGFVCVLVKPLAASEVATALRRWVPSAMTRPAREDVDHAPLRTGAAAVWDDAASLRAMNGNPEHVRLLRELFLNELPAVVARVSAAVRGADAASLQDELHRLSASCGFVGAAALALATRDLGTCADENALLGFEMAARELLAAGRVPQSA